MSHLINVSHRWNLTQLSLVWRYFFFLFSSQVLHPQWCWWHHQWQNVTTQPQCSSPELCQWSGPGHCLALEGHEHTGAGRRNHYNYWSGQWTISGVTASSFVFVLNMNYINTRRVMSSTRSPHSLALANVSSECRVNALHCRPPGSQLKSLGFETTAQIQQCLVSIFILSNTTARHRQLQQ